MRKILVLSDSHGYGYKISDILEKHRDVNMIVHLGDSIDELELIEASGLPSVCVAGNCDVYSSSLLPGSAFFKVEDLAFLAVHGHVQRVKMGKELLIQTARQRGADVCLFGHTHVQEEFERDGMIFFNPGSVGNGKYGIIEVNGKKISIMKLNI